MSEPLKGDIIAQLEQLVTMLENIAVPLAQYYKSLIENGVPDDLAKHLVVEMQRKLIYNDPNGGFQ